MSNAKETPKHFNYAPGDQVQDLTFDPPINGIVVKALADKPNAYFVRLSGGVNDVIIHARNLRLAS